MPLAVPHQINYVTKILCVLQTDSAYDYQRGGRKYFSITVSFSTHTQAQSSQHEGQYL